LPRHGFCSLHVPGVATTQPFASVEQCVYEVSLSHALPELMPVHAAGGGRHVQTADVPLGLHVWRSAHGSIVFHAAQPSTSSQV
jgi:hypothetical protein